MVTTRIYNRLSEAAKRVMDATCAIKVRGEALAKPNVLSEPDIEALDEAIRDYFVFATELETFVDEYMDVQG